MSPKKTEELQEFLKTQENWLMKEEEDRLRIEAEEGDPLSCCCQVEMLIDKDEKTSKESISDAITK